VAEPLLFLADNHVRQPIIEGLRRAGGDVVRAVDALGERNDDEIVLAYAAQERRIFVTNDEGIHVIAHRWLRESRLFRMIYWRMGHHREMSDGAIVRAIGEIVAKPDAFAYPIEYIKPAR
jgi:hypothetical protein